MARRSLVRSLADVSTEEMRETFAAFDRNSDGTIVTGKLGVVLRALGQPVSKDVLAVLTSLADADGSGSISFEVFEDVARKAPGIVRADEERLSLIEAFAVLDSDGDGKISKEDLCTVLPTLSLPLEEDVIVRVMQLVDRDGDGAVNYEEFAELLTNPALDKLGLDEGEELTDAELEDVRETFAVFDRSSNGCIDTAKLGIVLRALGRAVDEVCLARLVELADPDGSGEIAFERFLVMLRRAPAIVRAYEEQQEMEAAFKVFDTDGDGSISIDDMKTVLPTLSLPLDEKTMNSMLRLADRDGDGYVKYKDFAALLSMADDKVGEGD